MGGKRKMAGGGQGCAAAVATGRRGGSKQSEGEVGPAAGRGWRGWVGECKVLGRGREPLRRHYGGGNRVGGALLGLAARLAVANDPSAATAAARWGCAVPGRAARQASGGRGQVEGLRDCTGGHSPSGGTGGGPALCACGNGDRRCEGDPEGSSRPSHSTTRHRGPLICGSFRLACGYVCQRTPNTHAEDDPAQHYVLTLVRRHDNGRT